MFINCYDFNDLISPLSKEEFLQEYWEKKPLVLTSRGVKGYKPILSLEEIESLISNYAPSPEKIPWIRFVKNKNELSIEDYLIKLDWGYHPASIVDAEKVLNGYSNGNTIILNFLDRRWEPIRRLSEMLTDVLGYPAGANAYLTPPRAQGFPAHYDMQDVFILQLEGKKLWKLYENYFPFPIKGLTETKPVEPGPLLCEVNLCPGDLLYIPRGWVHEALTGETYSLHLTAGIYPLTWGNLFSELLNEMPEFRRSIPKKVLHSKGEEIPWLDYLKELQRGCEETANWEKALDRIKQKMFAKRVKPFHFGLAAEINLEKMNEETLFKKKEGVAPVIQTEELETTIAIGEKVISGPAYMEPVLEAMMAKSSFSAKTLPDALSLSGKMNLIRLLVRARFLEVASAEG